MLRPKSDRVLADIVIHQGNSTASLPAAKVKAGCASKRDVACDVEGLKKFTAPDGLPKHRLGLFINFNSEDGACLTRFRDGKKDVWYTGGDKRIGGGASPVR